MLTAADANITALTRQRAVHFNYDPFLVSSRIEQACLRSD
jgi:hypothetical protein